MKVKIQDVCERGASNLKQSDIDKNGEYPVYGAAGYIGKIDFYHQEKTYIAVVKDGAGIGRIALCPAKSSVIGTMQYLLPKDNVLPEYLFYVLKYAHLEKYYTGATIPHIYFKDYRNEEFNLVSLSEQAEIVDVLRKIEGIIESRKQELQKLDDLIKARFVEMFGDPVSNPMGWKQVLLCDVTSKIGSGATPRGGKESYQAEGITLIRSMNVHDGRFKHKDLVYITEAQAAQLDNVTVEENDVFINITGASVARSCIVPKEVLPARVNQHVAIIRCIYHQMHPVFINNMFLSDRFKERLFEIGKSGGATRQAITKQQLETLTVILPPITLQNQFADFVAQVDKSRFVEMFGDISTGEYKYVIKKLGDVAKVGSSHRVFTTDFGCSNRIYEKISKLKVIGERLNW